MNSIGTATVRSLQHSTVGGKLSKPLNEYTFSVIERGCNGDLLCVVHDGPDALCIADVHKDDVGEFTPSPGAADFVDVLALIGKVISGDMQ